MPYQTYSELRDTIARWLARKDLENDIPVFIWNVECEAQRELKLRSVETSTSGKWPGTKGYLELPEDLLEPRWIELGVNDRRAITVGTPSYAMSLKNTGATQASPHTGFVLGDRLYTAPTPGDQTPYTLFYHAGIAHLGPQNESSWLLENHGDYLLYGALKQAAAFLQDDARVGLWHQEFLRLQDQIRKQEWRARTGHGPLQMRSDTWQP